MAHLATRRHRDPARHSTPRLRADLVADGGGLATVPYVILVAAVVVGVLLAGLAVFQLLLAAGRWARSRCSPTPSATSASRGVTGYFSLGVPVNAISRSRPERLVMTPVVLLLALSCLVVALG